MSTDTLFLCCLIIGGVLFLAMLVMLAQLRMIQADLDDLVEEYDEILKQVSKTEPLPPKKRLIHILRSDVDIAFCGLSAKHINHISKLDFKTPYEAQGHLGFYVRDKNIIKSLEIDEVLKKHHLEVCKICQAI